MNRQQEDLIFDLWDRGHTAQNIADILNIRMDAIRDVLALNGPDTLFDVPAESDTLFPYA